MFPCAEKGAGFFNSTRYHIFIYQSLQCKHGGWFSYSAEDGASLYISVGKCPKEAADGLEFTAYNKGRHRKIGFKQSLTTVQYINIGGTGVKWTVELDRLSDCSIH
jgi:hypothetical protein